MELKRFTVFNGLLLRITLLFNGLSGLFSAEDEFEDYADPHVVGRCRALYDYDASQNDELSIRPGEYYTHQ